MISFMALNFVCRNTMLRALFLSHLVASLYSVEATLSSNSLTGAELDNHRWIVLKEEIFTPVEDPELKTVENSGAYVKTSIQHNTESTRSKVTLKKDPSLFSCSNVTLKIGEYEFHGNDTLYVKAFQLTLDSSFYIKDGDLVTICKPNKKEEFSVFGKALLAILTFTYSLITMISALCSFSKNSTYLKLAFVSWICISSNIFLWIIVILIIPGSQSVFSWVSLSVNMNQSVYLTSVWMALLTSNRALKFLQDYRFIEISKRVVTVNVGPLAIMSICLAFVLAVANFIADKLALFNDHAITECLFCNPVVYGILFLIMVIEGFFARFDNNFNEVGRDYAAYHICLCKFSVFNFICIALGSVAVMYEAHLLLWLYTMLNFVWPMMFVKYIIPRLQALLALASGDAEEKFDTPEKIKKEWEM